MSAAVPLKVLVATAKALEHPVRDLDALLVPLSHGLTDSHGQVVTPADITCQRLQERLETARLAIVCAQHRLHFTEERTSDAIQPRD